LIVFLGGGGVVDFLGWHFQCAFPVKYDLP